MTFDEKIKALNDLAVAWYSTSQADTIHEAIFRGQGLGKFADHCKEEAEEEHCAWVAKHLAIIEKLGYENYLLEMIDI